MKRPQDTPDLFALNEMAEPGGAAAGRRRTSGARSPETKPLPQVAETNVVGVIRGLGADPTTRWLN
jgi:hypothetical protein